MLWISFYLAISFQDSKSSLSQSTRLQIEQLEASISKEFKVTVHSSYAAETFFSPTWRAAPISAKGEAMPVPEVLRVLKLFGEFARRHPKSILRTNLRHLFLNGKLEFYGKQYGAANGKDSIYIVTDGTEVNCTDAFLLGRFHSEFSSVLLKNYRFPKKEWQDANEPFYKYPENRLQVLEDGKQYDVEEKLLIRGFVVRYAMASMEEDFNMITEWLFVRSAELIPLVKRYPRIKRKTELAIQYYTLIDSSYEFKEIANAIDEINGSNVAKLGKPHPVGESKKLRSKPK